MDLEQIELLLDDQTKVAEEVKRLNLQKPSARPERDAEVEIFQWNMMITQMDMQKDKRKAQMRITTISGDSHICKTPFDQLTPIRLCEMEVPKIHKGRYLVCKTVVTPFAMVSTATLIQDLNGDVEEVSFFNFRYEFTDASWLKLGTVIIIKEPYIRYGSQKQSISMRVDSPSDVIFVDPTDIDFLKKIGAEKWYVNETKDVEEIKKKGNNCFMRKDYDGALMLYNRALRYSPDLAVLYLNKASTCLRSGHFQLAYEAAKTGLEKGGDREKAFYRLGLAAYGLRDWKTACEHFEMLISEFPTNKEACKELKRAKKRLNENQNGSFDFKSMFLSNNNGQKEFEVADYTLQSIEICQIPGKDRGIIAKDDIEKGTLLMVSKAFACGYVNDGPSDLVVVDLIKRGVDNVAAKLQIIRAIDNLQKTPHRAKELYDMYAGDSTKCDVPEGVIDTALIEKISVHNAFGNVDNVRLFILPAYFNHSCIANTCQIFYGDVMIVYANTNIKKGEEITGLYKSPVQPYAERSDSLIKGWGFECKCELCEVEKADQNCSERAQLLKTLQEIAKQHENDPEQAIVKGTPILNQIRDSYTNRSKFKLELAQALVIIDKMYFNLNEPALEIQYLKEAVELIDERLQHDFKVPAMLVDMAGCYLAMHQMKKATEVAYKAFNSSFCVNEDHFKEVYPDVKSLF